MPTELLDQELPQDYRACFDKDYLGAWDLQGRDVVVEIARVKVGKVEGVSGKKDRKIVMWFKGKEKGMVVNITNATTIAGMYGKNPANWIGKPVALYPATTRAPGQPAGTMTDCIRVRPEIPQKKQRQREPGEEG